MLDFCNGVVYKVGMKEILMFIVISLISVVLSVFLETGYLGSVLICLSLLFVIDKLNIVQD